MQDESIVTQIFNDVLLRFNDEALEIRVKDQTVLQLSGSRLHQLYDLIELVNKYRKDA